MNSNPAKTDLPIDALILAGRRQGETDPLASIDNVSHKALLTAGGAPLIKRVVAALRATNRISQIRISAPKDVRDEIASVLQDFSDWKFVDPENSPAKSVLAAIENIEPGRALLTTTCDHALLSVEMVTEFLAGAGKFEAAAACVEKSAYQARFPNSRRTFIRLKNFSFSGANLFWFAGERAKGLADFWRGLETKRKNPAAMAREIGVLTALSYAAGLMTKNGLEETIRKKTGVAARLVPLSDAEAAIDVDKPEDLTLVREILSAR